MNNYSHQCVASHWRRRASWEGLHWEERVGNEIRPKELNFVHPSPAANPPGVPTHSVGFSLFRFLRKSGVTFRSQEISETCELNGRSIRYFYRSNSILPYERSLYTALLCVFILGKSFRGKLAAIDRVYPFRYSFLRRLAGNKEGLQSCGLGVVRPVYLLVYFILFYFLYYFIILFILLYLFYIVIIILFSIII